MEGSGGRSEEGRRCKEYAEKGCCKYGDACKFPHLKASSQERKAQARCVFCALAPTRPVKTRCGHMFCLNCALHMMRQFEKCVVCDEDTFKQVEIISNEP
jgi:Zinc finger, C3HC4 type (RING finger)/Zinc finger C-x8-C-x5-C-x3-H type (and similar)